MHALPLTKAASAMCLKPAPCVRLKTEVQQLPEKPYGLPETSCKHPTETSPSHIARTTASKHQTSPYLSEHASTRPKEAQKSYFCAPWWRWVFAAKKDGAQHKTRLYQILCSRQLMFLIQTGLFCKMVHAKAVRKPMLRLRALAPVSSLICTHLFITNQASTDFFLESHPVYHVCLKMIMLEHFFPARGLAFGAFSLLSLSEFSNGNRNMKNL